MTDYVKENLMFPRKWGDNPKVSGTFLESTHENFELSAFGLKCYNIGFGTAKKITITFSYDIDAFIDLVNKLNEFVSEDKRITIKKEGIFISFDCKNKDLPFVNSTVAIEGVLKHYISYVLPVNITSDYSYIKLPLHYLEMLNIYVFLFSTIDHKQEKNIEIEIPIHCCPVKIQNDKNFLCIG